MTEVNLAKAKSSFSEYASRAAYSREHIIITKRGKPFVALISVKDLELLERIKAGSPEDGLLGAVGMAPELEKVAEKAMEAYQKRADYFGREVEI
jgi:prevent-host-death family protein